MAALEVEALFSRGDYNAAILQSTKALKDAKDDARVLYFRGYAAYLIGDYQVSRSAMSAIGDFNPHPETPAWKNFSAPDFVRKIDAMERLAPLSAPDVRVGDRVIFQFHLDKQNAWSQAVIALLPQAYEINRAFVGKDIPVIPVFLFSDPDHFARFQALRTDGMVVGSWAWASGNTEGLYFGQGVGPAPSDVTSSYFRSTVVHELNHSFVRRLTDTAYLPRWFEEGIAMTAGVLLQTDEIDAWEGEFQKALDANALLTLDEVTQFIPFREATERSLKGQSDARPFAQLLNMTSYFLSLVPPDKLAPFLEEVRVTRNFDKALLEFTNLTPQAFYDQWRAYELAQKTP